MQAALFIERDQFAVAQEPAANLVIQELALFYTFSIQSGPGDNLLDVTPQVRQAIERSGIREGVCHINVPHTTAALTLSSALDPGTAADVIAELKKLVPTRVDFAHQFDTPADAAGHIKSVLVGTSQSVPIHNSKLA